MPAWSFSRVEAAILLPIIMYKARVKSVRCSLKKTVNDYVLFATEVVQLPKSEASCFCFGSGIVHFHPALQGERESPLFLCTCYQRKSTSDGALVGSPRPTKVLANVSALLPSAT